MATLHVYTPPRYYGDTYLPPLEMTSCIMLLFVWSIQTGCCYPVFQDEDIEVSRKTSSQQIILFVIALVLFHVGALVSNKVHFLDISYYIYIYIYIYRAVKLSKMYCG